MRKKNLQFRKFKTKHFFLFTWQLFPIVGCTLIGCTITGWKLTNEKFLNVEFSLYDLTLPNSDVWDNLETVRVGPTKVGSKFW